VATAASFKLPIAAAVDSSGDIYVADYGNNLIREISPSLVVTTLAGGGTSFNGTGTAAQFDGPTGIAVDSSGNVYVADWDNQLIRKITGGVVSTFAGQQGVTGATNATGTAASFNYPNSVAVDSSGNIYIADEYNQLIREITPGGVVSTLAGQAGVTGATNATGTAATFNYPQGIAVDSSGNVYVGDTNNFLIRKITPGGVVSTLAGSGTGMAVNGTGTAASFDGPTGVAVDSSGNVYVADHNADEIRKISPGGVVTTLAGQDRTIGSTNGPGNVALFNSPYGVAVDTRGNVYVADFANNLIRKIYQ
jgi:sugar lactone lactonase YvrE